MSNKLLDDAALRRALSLRDLTDPTHGPHALQSLVDDAVRALAGAWRCRALVHRASPVVRVADNYDRLGYTRDAVTRDARYTRYVSSDAVLRTQTSALIPPLLEVLAASPPGDVLVACPGVVYRRDSIDRHHVGEPHQLDLWRVRRGALGARDLEEMIDLVVRAVLPGATHRTEPAVHPYTICGLQIDVLDDAGSWVEIGECGLAHPELLARSGLDPAEYGGLAMGLGLDRLLMLRKGIDDIRLLRSDDPRVAAQMLDLTPYRPVSQMPPITRDLSLALGEAMDDEAIGDRVRSALGDAADAVEHVAVRSCTPASELPAVARERLGMNEAQVNVLVRVVLRHPTRTLTHEEANELRDAIYAELHEGTVHAWASRARREGRATSPS